MVKSMNELRHLIAAERVFGDKLFLVSRFESPAVMQMHTWTLPNGESITSATVGAMAAAMTTVSAEEVVVVRPLEV